MAERAGTTAAVSVGPDGRAVVVKSAHGDQATRLRHEAEVLRAASHPGVVEVVTLTERPDGGVTLTTAFAGVAVTTPAPDAAGAARVLATVAATLADLHERGVVHGRLTADHVVLGADGAAVLCGFGGGALRATPGGPVPGDDVTTLADLAGALLADEGEGVAASIRSVLDRVRAADPAARPTMRALAGALAPLAGTPPPGPRLLVARRDPPARRLRWMVAVALGAIVLAGGVARTLGPDGDAGAALPALPTTAPGAPPTSRALAPPTTAPPTTAPTTAPTTTVSPCPRPEAVTGADVDGDGCAEAVGVEGATLTVDGSRWAVGRTGEVAVVGDWDCDGRASPAVLRPADGSVWVYRAWAEGEVAVAAGTVPGAVALRAADPDADGCESLLVERGDGTTTLVDGPG